MSITKIILKAGRDESLRRFHPWVFSGGIERIEGKPNDGDIVEVYDRKGECLGTGHYHQGSISVRLVAFEQATLDLDFWVRKIEAARAVRKAVGLLEHPQTNAFRLVHAEGDGLSGLIIDWYNGTAVVQCHSIGMHQALPLISQALQQVFGDALVAVYDKSKASLPPKYASTLEQSYVYGATSAANVSENDVNFHIDWVAGQKTGFFLDQRDNRQLLERYAKDKNVLNAFCYTGGFSMYALRGGAKLVHSVDASQSALDILEQNLALNPGFAGTHESFCADVQQFLKKSDFQYDLMVLDPPAFAKSLDKRHNAVQGYKRLNAAGIAAIAPGGVLFTFSCSQVIDRQLFQNTIMAAAIETGRKVRILHHLEQPADHPVSIYHPESSYLKGLVLYVE